MQADRFEHGWLFCFEMWVCSTHHDWPGGCIHIGLGAEPWAVGRVFHS